MRAHLCLLGLCLVAALVERTQATSSQHNLGAAYEGEKEGGDTASANARNLGSAFLGDGTGPDSKSAEGRRLGSAYESDGTKGTDGKGGGGKGGKGGGGGLLDLGVLLNVLLKPLLDLLVAVGLQLG